VLETEIGGLLEYSLHCLGIEVALLKIIIEVSQKFPKGQNNKAIYYYYYSTSFIYIYIYISLAK
jgi:hypothetical protein